MTRDEILAMPAGKEMNILIATRIFGEVEGKISRYGDSWNFSNYISAAWEIVEYLTDNGYCPGLLFDNNGHWALSFDGAQSIAFGEEPVDVSTSFFVDKYLWCDTAPLAICRAALLATLED